MSLIIRWFILAFALYIVAQIAPGMHIRDFGVALVAAAVFGLVNILVKPIVFLFALPVTILTFGLFSFIINALMLWLASSFVSGFDIEGLGSALIASILLTIVSTLLFSLVK